MEKTNLIELNGVYCGIKSESVQKEIINNIDLKIKKGDFVCIMGPTGCGKSTLMKIMTGHVKVTDGIVSYNREVIRNGIPKEELKEMGIAYQSDSLFEWLTVEKNIKQSINIFGVPDGMDVSARMDYLLNLVGLKNYRECYPHELSGGMRQRCAFARALMQDPKVLMLDQPFGALDAITRKLLGAELLKTWHDSKKTVVMITNNVAEALMLANKVIVLSAQPATVREVIDVNIPYAERFASLQENSEYIRLNAELNNLVRVSDS